MKHFVNPLQPKLFDPFQGLFGSLALKRLANGWQSIFRAFFLATMPALKLANHFSPDIGRPTKELYSVAGLLFLKEAFDWTYEQAVDAYLFHNDVQFALNLEPGTDQICVRTLYRYHDLFLEDDLAAEVMNNVTLGLIDQLDLNIDKQRLDSTHIFSNMANFGRTRMMAITNKRFLTQVQRHHAEDFAALPEELRQRYAPTQAKLFSGKGLSAEQRNKSRQQVAEDMRDLVDRFADHSGLNNRPSYHTLVTVFYQQCEIVSDKIVVKAKTGGGVVQNPSDLGATYDGHKGQGYQVQLVETCSEENDIQLILTTIPQTAAEHDSAALEPVLADLQKKDLLPEEMLADTHYGSDENVQMAADMGVELVTPTPGTEYAELTAEDSPATTAIGEPAIGEPAIGEPAIGEPAIGEPAASIMEKLTSDDFSVDERTGKVQACPSGRIPLNVLYNQGCQSDKTVIEMNAEDCESCPFREACPVEKSKKGKYKMEYTAKQRRLSERRREEDTEAFRQRYAKRSGIESTNSGLKKKHGLGQLCVRGSPSVYHAIYLKVAGWNLCRASASGKLACGAAEILRRLGLGGCVAAFLLVISLISRLRSTWRPVGAQPKASPVVWLAIP